MSKSLTFETLDDLALAVGEGLMASDAALPRSLAGVRLGPLIELHLLKGTMSWPPGVLATIEDAAFGRLMNALRAERTMWISDTGRSGFMLLGEAFGDDEETRWTGFGLKADQAMRAVGLPAGLAGQLVGATKELHSNGYEHSERSRTGIVAFASHQDMAEFIVADSGIGVLASLKSNPKHAGIEGDAEALRLALQPGGSRYAGVSTRGHGFDLMFTGLLNRDSKLRFRSGTAAITIDGLAAGSPVPLIRDRPAMQGFLIAIDCHGFSPLDGRVHASTPIGADAT